MSPLPSNRRVFWPVSKSTLSTKLCGAGLRPVREVLRPLEVDRLAVRGDERRPAGRSGRAWSAARRGCCRTPNRCPRRRDHRRRRRRRDHRDRRPRSSRPSRSRSASLGSARRTAYRSLPFVHEQRLAVRAELGRRHAGCSPRTAPSRRSRRTAATTRRGDPCGAAAPVRRRAATAAPRTARAATAATARPHRPAGRRLRPAGTRGPRQPDSTAGCACAVSDCAPPRPPKPDRRQRVVSFAHRAVPSRSGRFESFGQHLSGRVPHLLDRSEVRHRNEVRVRLGLQRDAEVLAVGRRVDVGDQRRARRSSSTAFVFTSIIASWPIV